MSGEPMRPADKVRRFPWYDGGWLEHFVDTKAYILEHCPERLPLFLETLAPLRTAPEFEARHLPGLIDATTLAEIQQAMRALRPDELELHEIKRFGRWVVHDNPILTRLQSRMTRLVEEVVGEAIEPSYNFLSLYTRLGRCPLHMDAPLAKWTLDICIDQSEPWPIQFGKVRPWPEEQVFPVPGWEDAVLADNDNRFSSVVMQPGDAIVFAGSSQWHYRDRLASQHAKSHCHLLFFHFIPRGMRDWLDPAGWESRFGLPGLSAALGDPEAVDVGASR